MRRPQHSRGLDHQTSAGELAGGVTETRRLPFENPAQVVDRERPPADRKGRQERGGIAAEDPQAILDQGRPIPCLAAEDERLQPERRPARATPQLSRGCIAEVRVQGVRQ